MALTIGVYPGFQEINLVPGEIYEGSFLVVNTGGEGEESVNFRILSAPLTVSEDGTTNDYISETERTEMSKWITFETKTGTIAPNSTKEIKYKIDVPENAMVGGQYCAAMVRIDQLSPSSEGIHVGSIYQVANLIYATVDGELDYSGEVLSNTIHPIFLNSKIQTSVMVKNLGNVHMDVASYIKVYKLFSDEELYTTEGNARTSTVVPGTTKEIVNTWNSSPQLGLFRVVQTVSMAGQVNTESNVVLVAPLWFIVVWAVFIISCIVWFFGRRHVRRSSVKNSKSFDRPKISR